MTLLQTSLRRCTTCYMKMHVFGAVKECLSQPLPMPQLPCCKLKNAAEPYDGCILAGMTTSWVKLSGVKLTCDYMRQGDAQHRAVVHRSQAYAHKRRFSCQVARNIKLLHEGCCCYCDWLLFTTGRDDEGFQNVGELEVWSITAAENKTTVAVVEEVLTLTVLT